MGIINSKKLKNASQTNIYFKTNPRYHKINTKNSQSILNNILILFKFYDIINILIEFVFLK